MASVKQITTEGRTKNRNMENKNSDVINLIGESNDDAEDDSSLQAVSEESGIRVINKSKQSELNFEKQYKRRVNHCMGRKLFRIHDFTKPVDHGSQNKSLVYVEFQGGLFESKHGSTIKGKIQNYKNQ